MQFKKITATKYAGTDGYSLRVGKDGRYSIFKGNTVAKWGIGFQTIQCAENFISNHDYISASDDAIALNLSDIDFIASMYGFSKIAANKWVLNKNCYIKASSASDKSVSAILVKNKQVSSAHEHAESLIDELDAITGGDIISSSIIRGTELRSVFAARDRRSAREIAQNLVRVKSSNVWAYGVEIKDNKATKGDVYVQFKGKNGGPGDVYKYYDVSINVWRKFLSYPSKGAFVWKYLRNNFLYSKLTGDKLGKLPNAINH